MRVRHVYELIIQTLVIVYRFAREKVRTECDIVSRAIILGGIVPNNNRQNETFCYAMVYDVVVNY